MAPHNDAMSLTVPTDSSEVEASDLGLSPARRGQSHQAATVANTVAETLDSARRTWAIPEYRSSPRPVTDGPGQCAHSYGSEGEVAAVAYLARPPSWTVHSHSGR